MKWVVDADAKAEATDSDEFQQFADLAGKLVQVPKSELDEKRQTS